MLFLGACQGEQRLQNPAPGIADLRPLSPTDQAWEKPRELKGPWFQWPGQLLSHREALSEIESEEPCTVSLPATFQRLGPLEPSSDLIRYRTLALKLKLPENSSGWTVRLPNISSSARLYADDKLIAEIGRADSRRALNIPRNVPAYGRIPGDDRELLLRIQMINFHEPISGFWSAPTIAPVELMAKSRMNALVVAALIAGALAFMGLYHFSLFLLRREDKNILYFGLICLFMAVRTLIMGDKYLAGLFPFTKAAWECAFVIEHMSAHMVLPLFFLFFHGLFPRQISKPALRTVLAVSTIWALLEIATPAIIHQRFLSWFEFFLAIAGAYLLVMIFWALLKQEDGAGTSLTGIAVLLATSVNDVLYSNGIIESIYMASVGVFLYTFIQGFSLSRNFAKLFHMVSRYTKELQIINSSLERFIPHEVLRFLNKKSIVDIELGDFSQEEMTVFFLDIRDFTSLSETMSPNDNFRFINSCLKRFGPPIRENRGFVDKYIGDGIMALFPEDPDDALRAALRIRKLLVELNRQRTGGGWKAINVGMGIHTGELMLGTIGENRRMDSTVISDTVNTASRLETLTKTVHCDILVSEQTIKKLHRPKLFEYSSAGHFAIRGKREDIEVFTLDDGNLTDDDLIGELEELEEAD